MRRSTRCYATNSTTNSDEKDRSPWRFYYNFVRELPLTYYQRQQWNEPMLNGSLPGRATYEVPSPIFTVWTESMFDYRSNDRMRVGGVTPLSVVAFDSTAPQKVREVEIAVGKREVQARAMRKSNLLEAETPQVRTNFSETAFFPTDAAHKRIGGSHASLHTAREFDPMEVQCLRT